MKLKVDQIFAPTAAMLYQFREVAILGRCSNRYDQPGLPGVNSAL